MASKRDSKRNKSYMEKVIIIIGINIILITVVLGVISVIYDKDLSDLGIWVSKSYMLNEPDIMQMHITPNKYSRPEISLNNVNGVVIHYTANPGTGAINNRNYFEGLKDSKSTYASSHFIIGIEGEIISCVPLDEIAYASNDRNNDTISIECCHENEDGKFSKATYDSLVWLVAWLCDEYNIKNKDILRHYDITGKKCPKYYVDNPDEWEMFKKDVEKYFNENKVKKK